MMTGKTQRGADLKLTLHMKVQRVAAKALGDRKGAVVALDPAYRRHPGHGVVRPGTIRTPRRRMEERWSPTRRGLSSTGRSRVSIPPARRSRSIVASAGLRRRARVHPDTQFNDTGIVSSGGYEINNYGGKVYGDHTFAEAFAQQHQHHLRQGGRANSGPTRSLGMPTRSGSARRSPGAWAESRASSPTRHSMDTAQVAQASIGQGGVLATPILMGWRRRPMATVARS